MPHARTWLQWQFDPVVAGVIWLMPLCEPVLCLMWLFSVQCHSSNCTVQKLFSCFPEKIFCLGFWEAGIDSSVEKLPLDWNCSNSSQQKWPLLSTTNGKWHMALGICWHSWQILWIQDTETWPTHRNKIQGIKATPTNAFGKHHLHCDTPG